MRSKYNGNCAAANNAMGRHVTAYTGNAANFSSSPITKKWLAQKDITMEATEMKREVRPNMNFFGKPLQKSLSSYREVRIERNTSTAVTEKQSATSEVIAKTSNADLPSSVGAPVSFLTPPGTVLAVAKATVAKSAATTEQELDVLVSHVPPSLTKVLCDSVKISSGVLPLLL